MIILILGKKQTLVVCQNWIINMNRWLTFKFMSSFILLVMVTVFSFMYETSATADLWLCVWCLCLVRFVDVVDEY